MENNKFVIDNEFDWNTKFKEKLSNVIYSLFQAFSFKNYIEKYLK